MQGRKRIMDRLLFKLPAGDAETYNQPSIPCVQQTMPFTELPAEIRNRIYELALPTKDHDHLILATPARDDLMILGVQPGITRATRQTRAESLSMFYASNIFEAYIDHFDFRELIHVVRCISSAPSPPRIRIHIKLLHRMTCYRGVFDLACAWLRLNHSKIHVTVHSCFTDGTTSRPQSSAVAEAINIAERRAAVGDVGVNNTRAILFEKIYTSIGWSNALEMDCKRRDHCTCEQGRRIFELA